MKVLVFYFTHTLYTSLPMALWFWLILLEWSTKQHTVDVIKDEMERAG